MHGLEYLGLIDDGIFVEELPIVQKMKKRRKFRDDENTKERRKKKKSHRVRQPVIAQNG